MNLSSVPIWVYPLLLDNRVLTDLLTSLACSLWREDDSKMSVGPSGFLLELKEGNGEQSSAKSLTAAFESWLKNRAPSFVRYSIL